MPFIDVDPRETWKRTGGKSPPLTLMNYERMLPVRKRVQPVEEEGAPDVVPLPKTLAERREIGQEQLGRLDTGSDKAGTPTQEQVDDEEEHEKHRLNTNSPSILSDDGDVFSQRRASTNTYDDSENRLWQQRQQTQRPRSYDFDTLAAELRVKYRLLPAIVLLSHPNILLSDPDLRQASEHAVAAWRIAKDLRVNEALRARCAYYVGLAEWLLTEKDEHGVPLTYSQPGSPESYESRGAGQAECVRYFREARAAKGVYREGELAEQWLSYFKTAALRSPSSAEARPESAGSWVAGLWEWVRRTKPEAESQWWRSPPRQRQGEGGEPIPDYSSWGSGSGAGTAVRRDSGTEQGKHNFHHANPHRIGPKSAKGDDDLDEGGEPERPLPKNITGGNINIKDFSPSSLNPSESISQHWQPPPAKKIYRITNPDPSTSSTTTTIRTTNPPQALPNSPTSKSAPAFTPQTSPTFTAAAAAASHTRSVTIAFANDLESGISTASEKSSSIYQRRRKPSLLALVTGRERRPSELERMEEGDSPYRNTFEEESGVSEFAGSGSWKGLKKRKVAEPEDLV